MDKLYLDEIRKEQDEWWENASMDERCLRAPKFFINGDGPFVAAIYYDQLLDLARREINAALNPNKDSDRG